MKYLFSLIIIFCTIPSFATECNRKFEAYIVEKGKGKLPNHMNILLQKGHLYIGNNKIQEDNYVFTYQVRYDNGKMYTGDKTPLNTIDLFLSDGIKHTKMITISITDDKRITITDNEDNTPSFFNLSFDEQKNIFILGLNIDILKGCKIKTQAELQTGVYKISGANLSVNTDHGHFTMKGTKFIL